MVLWALVAETDLPYEVLHVNFGLRGGASDADEALVVARAAALGVECHVERPELGDATAGVQAAARRHRRQSTERLLAYCSAAVLAHHADDQAETVLMRLARGTGGRGLVGMQPVYGRYLRPLLDIRKEALAAFAKTHRVAFREDASNATDAYARNRFRHHVLPVLTQVEPRAVGGIGLSAKRQAQLVAFAGAHAKEVLAQARVDAVARPDSKATRARSDTVGTDAAQTFPAQTDATATYDRAALAAIPGLGFVLQEWLSPYGFKSALVDDLCEWVCDGLPHRRVCLNSNKTLACSVAGRRVTLGPT